MVRIRLARFGRRNRPFFRIAVFDSRTPRDGRYIEKVGTYDPIEKPGKKVIVNQERVRYWLERGAQPTPTVRDLLKSSGLQVR